MGMICKERDIRRVSENADATHPRLEEVAVSLALVEII
jgi:hypothetical protein